MVPEWLRTPVVTGVRRVGGSDAACRYFALSPFASWSFKVAICPTVTAAADILAQACPLALMLVQLLVLRTGSNRISPMVLTNCMCEPRKIKLCQFLNYKLAPLRINVQQNTKSQDVRTAPIEPDKLVSAEKRY